MKDTTTTDIIQMQEEFGKKENTAKKSGKFNQFAALAFCEKEEIKENLCYVDDLKAFSFYQDKKGYFKIIEPKKEQKFFYKYFGFSNTRNITQSVIKDIIWHISMQHERVADNLISDFLALNDKLLNTKDFTLHDFTREKISFYNLELDSKEVENLDDEIPKESLFQKFINEVFVQTDTTTTDLQLQSLAQEMVGYCLVPTIKSEATFFMKGIGGNGKGVLTELILKILGGEGNYSATHIEQLTSDRFAYGDLLGKRVNICNENESELVKADKFKALVSGDPLRIEKKYGDSYTGRIPIKFIFSTNDFPKFTGFDQALVRRLKILPFNRAFTEVEKDNSLRDKLLDPKEFKYFCKWALQGLKRLVGRDFKFTECDQSNKAIEEERNKASSVIQFIVENFKEDPDNLITYDELYSIYADKNIGWCTRKGKKAKSYDNFVTDISRSNILKIPPGRKYDIEDKKKKSARYLSLIIDIEEIIF